MIKDYIIKEKLGIGAFGTVYKVLKKSNNNIYVIKRISLIGLTPKQLKNVKLESKILSSVKSPFIVQYYESFEENNFLNIVMEYCDGGDLSEYIYNNKQTKILLEEKKVWNIFLKILLGLYHLHKLKILHRDLKPLNIFLTKNNFNYDIKIGDFGVAKILNQENFASTVIGTPYYLSPELCEELPYNDKSDVWALGCILYELCTYKHPFNAKCQASLVLKILENKPKPINKYYSDELQKLINLILDKNYQTRPSCYDIIHMPFVLDKIKNLGLYDNIEINDNDKSINEKNNLKRNYSNKTFFSVKLNIDDYNKINDNNNIKNIYKNNNINNIKENKQKNINDNTNYKNRFLYISKSIDNFKKLKIQKEQQRKTSNDIIIKKKPINNTKNKDINIKIINKIKINIDEYELKIKNEIKTNNIKKYKKPNLSLLNLDNDEEIIKNIKTTDILNNEKIDNMIENKLLKMKKNKKEINIKEFASFLNDNINKINLTNFKENNNNKIDKKELKFKKLKINI